MGCIKIDNSFDIKEICTNLRPAKVVILILECYEWHEKSLKIIEKLSQIWGGQRNLIIPTDGNKIDEEFWFLLEKFDPDYFFIYNNYNEENVYDISDELKKDILERLNPFHESSSKIYSKSFFRTRISLNFFNRYYPQHKN